MKQRLWVDAIVAQESMHGVSGMVPRLAVVKQDNTPARPAKDNRRIQTGWSATHDGGIKIEARRLITHGRAPFRIIHRARAIPSALAKSIGLSFGRRIFCANSIVQDGLIRRNRGDHDPADCP
jgi:hypothetical protein